VVLNGVAVEGLEDLLYAAFLMLKADWPTALAWFGAVVASAWTSRKVAAGCRKLLSGARSLLGAGGNLFRRLFGGIKKRRELKLAMREAAEELDGLPVVVHQSGNHWGWDHPSPRTDAKVAAVRQLVFGDPVSCFKLPANEFARLISRGLPGLIVKVRDGKTFLNGSEEVTLG